MLRETDYIIDEENFVERARIRPEGYGLVPRDTMHPVGCYEGMRPMEALNEELPEIPMEEWPERIAELSAKKMQLSDIRMKGRNGNQIPSTSQGRSNYCWAYTAASGILVMRGLHNLPYVELSPHFIGFKIKNGRNDGGWSAASVAWVMKNGCATSKYWKLESWDRGQDTAECREVALQFRISETCADLVAPEYNRDMSVKQQGSALLHRCFLACDYNWWGHAVGGLDLVDYDKALSARDPMRYGRRIWNSWDDSWGEEGMGVLAPKKAWADNCVAVRSVVYASAV